jgi:hypothetical protein
VDCLALTGSDPVPLTVLAVAMIVVAVVLLTVVRRARSGRRRHAGAAVAMTVALTMTMAGGLSLLGGAPAQAATDCVTGTGTTTSGTAAADPAADDATTSSEQESTPDVTVPQESTPEQTVPEETTPEETAPDETVPDETVPDETVPDETVPDEDPVAPVASTFTVALPVEDHSLTGVVTSERYTLVLTRASGEDDGSPITLVVPDSTDGYWVASALLNADGSVATDVTTTRESGATQFSIATQPEVERTFLLVLDYDTSTWDQGIAGTSQVRWRPASTLVASLTDHADAAGGTATLMISEYRFGVNGPPDEE